MKINAIKYDTTLKQGSFTVYKDPHNFKEKERAGVCEKKNNEDKTKFSGNFTGKSEVAASVIKNNKLKDKIFQSSIYNSLLKFAEDHNVAGSALMSLFLAGVLRPATIMALPGEKDKDDKIYASGHSMASGVIGFAASTVITSPWDQGVNSLMDNYKKHYEKIIENIKNGVSDINKGVPELKYKFKFLDKKYGQLVELAKKTLDKQGKIEQKALNKQIDATRLYMKNITDWAIAIPRSILTIALIPPILKYVFGMEKKPKFAPKADTVQQPTQVSNTASKVPHMDDFMKKASNNEKGGEN